MARDICERCKTPLFSTTDTIGEHLCADLRKRLARREKQKANVIAVLREYRVDTVVPPQDGAYTLDELAEAIVKKIVNMLAEDD